jgi:hypothetical protein
MMKGGRVPVIARMVVGDSRNFPDLARIWHDDVVSPLLDLASGLIVRAQGRGEVVAGDARLYAFGLMGPLVMGGLFHAVFGAVSGDAPDLTVLAAQHGRMAMAGLAKTNPPQEELP